MNKKILDILGVLGIPTYYQETSIKKDKYIIFSIYNERDTLNYDDTNLSTTYSITFNYWYKNGKDLELYKEIKRLLKENGFIFNGSNDLPKDGLYYGKNLDFIYEELL